MADFLSNLWSSILTPGPTPTLLIATNVSFGALQLTLFALLLATYSIHFLILSFLCGGLWYAINWFAAELAAAKTKEEEAERLRKRNSEKSGGDGEEGDDEGEDTEVEGEMRGSRSGVGEEKVEADARRQEEVGNAMATGATSFQTDQAARLRGPGEPGARRLSGEVSTDSEWEKVEDGR